MRNILLNNEKFNNLHKNLSIKKENKNEIESKKVLKDISSDDWIQGYHFSNPNENINYNKKMPFSILNDH